MYSLASIVFWTCCGLLIYTYAMYPLVVVVLARLVGTPVIRDDLLRPVTVVVTAYNEAKSIRAKLDNLVALEYPHHMIQILVVSDGSSDSTEEIAAAYEGRQIHVLRVEGRQGKTACQNAAALAADGEILVFTERDDETQSRRNPGDS